MTVHSRFGAQASMLSDGKRLHLHHGPIDLIVGADGPTDTVVRAYERAVQVFGPILHELVDELPLLRQPVEEHITSPLGAVAQRMFKASMKHSSRFITPMASVAGAVADHVLDAMTAVEDLQRAYVNNGGDLALHLAPNACFTIGIVANPVSGAQAGTITVTSEDRVRGIATSGWQGRSHSLGIADAVTVLAENAAAADAAATLIANAVNLPGHPAVRRTPARELSSDSDLGDRLVTVEVGTLARMDILRALERGVEEAESMCCDDFIHAAFLCCQDQVRCVHKPEAELFLNTPEHGRKIHA